jgi:hypothetical protein
MHFPLTSLGTAATAWLLLPGAASALCDVQSIDQNANDLCDGCQYDSAISMQPNETCGIGTAPRGRTGVDFVFLDGRILQKAKYGIASASSSVVVAYKPAIDFSGTDDFIAEYIGRQNGKLIRYKIHHNVMVQFGP